MLIRSLCTLTAFVGICLLAGCGGDTPAANPNSAAPGGATPAGSGKKRTIAVIPKSTSHEFWRSVGAGADQAAKEFNAEIVFKAGEPGDDHAAQITLFDQMLGQADAIVLAPTHHQFLSQCVTKAKERKVPLVIIDSGVDAKPEDYVSYIATNNKQGGIECGRRMGKLLNGKGSVIMLKLVAGSESTTQREDGFRETITKEFPGIKILQEKYGENKREDAINNAGQLISAQPEFDGVFACNETTTYGMLKALRERKLAGKVKFVGFDSAKEFIEAMENGEIDALAVQNPYKMGYEGVKAVCAALDGKTVEKMIDTGVVMVDKTNLKQPDIQKLVNPPGK